MPEAIPSSAFVTCCCRMGMGKTLQAISLIATHRTDDNSKLPRLTPAEGVQPLRQRKPDVLKLKLPGAPSRAPESELCHKAFSSQSLGNSDA